MHACTGSPALAPALFLTRAQASAHAQRKRCTADQTDVTTLPAHSALFGENKPPVRSEGETATVSKTFQNQVYTRLTQQ